MPSKQIRLKGKMKCTKCQFESPSNFKFCGQCGAGLEQACTKCGIVNPLNFKFCGNCGTSTNTNKISQTSSKPATAELILNPETEAERRHLTIMFCDLVGSTALSTRLDPEDLRYIVTEYQKVCQKVVARFEGHVAQYLGDGILVYFGYPMAH